MTLPSGTSELVASWTATARPAPSRAAIASACVLPATWGTWTSSGVGGGVCVGDGLGDTDGEGTVGFCVDEPPEDDPPDEVPLPLVEGAVGVANGLESRPVELPD